MAAAARPVLRPASALLALPPRLGRPRRCGAGAGGADPEGFVAAGFSACWERGCDLADQRELVRLLGETGHDGEAVVDAARADATAGAYAADTRRALAEGVFGSPSYILDGEVFWGQDRLDLLDDALASGRPPFGPGSGAALPVPIPIV